MTIERRNVKLLCFGEVLWDALPQGLFLGGAPYNVTYHLQKLGEPAAMLSAVGDDFLGQEILRRMKAKDQVTDFVSIHKDLPTGAVEVTLDEKGDASYNIVEPVAWDKIVAPNPLPEAFANDGVLVFGTLALRSSQNRETFEKLRELGNLRLACDVNLRPPHDDVASLLEFVRGVDLLKLNDDECARLMGVDKLPSEPVPSLERLSGSLDVKSICVTRGSEGAWFYNKEQGFFEANPVKVKVADTIGAGDSFMAGLVAGWLKSDFNSNIQRVLDRATKLAAHVASSEGAQPDYDPEKIFD